MPMNSHIEFYKGKLNYVERDSLHSEIRRMINEENLMNCQKVYLQLIRDLYYCNLYIRNVGALIKGSEEKFDDKFISEFRFAEEGCEMLLKKWELHLLKNSLCSGEPCN